MAEIRDIRVTAVEPEGRLKLGSMLATIACTLGYPDLKIQRDQIPAKPLKFDSTPTDPG